MDRYRMRQPPVLVTPIAEPNCLTGKAPALPGGTGELVESHGIEPRIAWGA